MLDICLLSPGSLIPFQALGHPDREEAGATYLHTIEAKYERYLIEGKLEEMYGTYTSTIPGLVNSAIYCSSNLHYGGISIH